MADTTGAGLQTMAQPNGISDITALLQSLGTKTSTTNGANIDPLVAAFTKGMAGLSPADATSLIQSIFATGMKQTPVAQNALGAAVGARTSGNSPLALALNDQNNQLSTAAMQALLQNNQQGLSTATSAANGIAAATKNTQVTAGTKLDPLTMLGVGFGINALSKSGALGKLGSLAGQGMDLLTGKSAAGAVDDGTTAGIQQVINDQAGSAVGAASNPLAAAGTDYAGATATTAGVEGLANLGATAATADEIATATAADTAGGLIAAGGAGAADALGGLSVEEIMSWAMLADGGRAGVVDTDEEDEEGTTNPPTGVPNLLALQPFLQYADGGSTDTPTNSAGLVRGAGTGTSDSIPVKNTTPGGSNIAISNKEYIIPADVVHAMGVQHFDKLIAAFHTPVRR